MQSIVNWVNRVWHGDASEREAGNKPIYVKKGSRADHPEADGAALSSSAHRKLQLASALQHVRDAISGVASLFERFGAAILRLFGNVRESEGGRAALSPDPSGKVVQVPTITSANHPAIKFREIPVDPEDILPPVFVRQPPDAVRIPDAQKTSSTPMLAADGSGAASAVPEAEQRNSPVEQPQRKKVINKSTKSGKSGKSAKSEKSKKAAEASSKAKGRSGEAAKSEQSDTPAPAKRSKHVRVGRYLRSGLSKARETAATTTAKKVRRIAKVATRVAARVKLAPSVGGHHSAGTPPTKRRS